MITFKEGKFAPRQQIVRISPGQSKSTVKKGSPMKLVRFQTRRVELGLPCRSLEDMETFENKLLEQSYAGADDYVSIT